MRGNRFPWHFHEDVSFYRSTVFAIVCLLKGNVYYESLCSSKYSLTFPVCHSKFGSLKNSLFFAIYMNTLLSVFHVFSCVCHLKSYNIVSKDAQARDVCKKVSRILLFSHCSCLDLVKMAF